MERNENQLLMHSIRDPIPLDSSKLEILADSSRINDITILPEPEIKISNFQLENPLSPLPIKKILSSPYSEKMSQFNQDRQDSSPGFRKNLRKKSVDVFHMKETEKLSRFVFFSKVLESKITTVIISCFTLYALFADDFRIISTMKETDYIFDGFTITCFIMFFIEIILSLFVKSNYLFSFFFWLDLISTMSLIIDITSINEEIFGDSSNNQNFAKKAGKASQIGTRTGRIIRLARLIRIVKLYKTYQQNSMKDKIIPTLFDESSPTLNISAQSNTKKQNFAFKVFNAKTQKQINPQVQSVLDNSQKLKDSPNFNFSNHDYSIDYQDNSIKDIKTKEQTEYKESRVGKKLSDLTMKRVIILVITLVFIVPLFSSSYYNETDYDYTIQLKIMTQMSDSSNINTTEILQLFQNYINYNQYRSNPIVYCQIPSIHMVFKTMEPKDLRNQEKQQLSYTLSGYSDPFVSTINIRQSAIMYSVMNILRTIFVSFILSIGSYFFSKDVNDLALRPIERMIIKVNKIASNPLASKNETLIFAKDKMQSETSIIENAITKIGVLLALGFGEAGTEIIALNIARSGDVDPMIAGKKRYSVFGFCDIRNFTDATEVLQQDVMVFVNSIAYIVHKTVDKFGGIANKNIGDAFLLVWKFPEEEIVTLEDGTLCLNKSKLVKNIADLTLISFAKIIAGINKKKAILNYRENKGLNERLPNYKVKMGFGLHIGWAIEGAIGSEFKIDASYLSPNVNLASRLEAATKQYGVSILISHELHSYFSKRTRSYCREIDRVTVKGSIKPIGLFTIDLQINNLNIIEKINEKSPSKRKIDHLSAKSNILELVYSNDFKCSLFFQLDNDLLLMTNQISEIFKNKFNEGYCKYIDGEWLKAKELLTESFTNSSEDGPTYTILKYMEGHNFYAGVDWPGYRELTEK